MFQVQNLNFLLIFGIFVSIRLTEVECLYENANLTEVVEDLELAINEALAYDSPSDFSSYIETTSSNVTDYGTFDFIVIGSGPAGSVIANRLTEIEGWTVLLLEAGSNDSVLNRIIGLSSYAAVSDNDWGHVLTPQENACGAVVNRSCAERCGRVIGGGASINQAVYARAHEADFARWVDIYGATGWSFDEVLPYYKKCENANYEPLAEGYHSTSGYLTVSNDADSDLTQAFIDGFVEAGYNLTDFNGPSTVGVTRIPLTYNPNVRQSPARSFLDSFLNRTNLEVSLNSFVTRVIISNETLNATGVEFVKNQTAYVANAKYEVIVAAGVWMSASILMHSGIGPREHLENLTISVIADLPVGQAVQDHVYFSGVIFKNNQTLLNYTFDEAVDRYAKHLRPLTTVSDVMAWSNYGENTTYVRPNIEFVINDNPHITGVSSPATLAFTDEALNYTVDDSFTNAQGLVAVWHPKSRGTITLQSNDPKDRPLIDPNLLAEDSDVEILVKGIQDIVAINKTSAFQNFPIEVYIQDAPGCDAEKFSKDWLICVAKYWSIPGWHGVGSNPIGNDTSTSVVNPKLLVHGFGNLRVADSSIIPESPSGHPQATVYMIGERAADIIKEAYGKL